jgi:hypothetical protein
MEDAPSKQDHRRVARRELRDQRDHFVIDGRGPRDQSTHRAFDVQVPRRPRTLQRVDGQGALTARVTVNARRISIPQAPPTQGESCPSRSLPWPPRALPRAPLR